jgi:hypothetical protein
MIEKSRQTALNIYSLRRADHSSRGVIPSVIEEPHRGGLDPLGLSDQEREKKIMCQSCIFYECIQQHTVGLNTISLGLWQYVVYTGM